MLNLKPVTFELSKYGLKAFGGVDDAYIPLSVFNALVWQAGRRFTYNGKSVICRDATTENLPSDFENTWLKSDERPKELVDFSYNMLCFIHDYIYGHPGYYGFADADKNGYCDASGEAAVVQEADKLSFDAFVQKYAPAIHAGLKSSSNTEYIKALHKLIVSVYGDGHTGMAPPKVSSLPGLANYKLPLEEYSGKIYIQQKEMAGILKDENDCPRRNAQSATLTEGDRKFTLSGATSTSEDGKPNLYMLFSSDFKTAVIHFDKFAGVSEDWMQTKYAEWKAYRAGGSAGTKPDYPVDSLGLFYFAFEKIEEQEASGKTIKNIVIDVSANSGGAVLEVGTLLAFLLSDGTTKTVLTDNLSINLRGIDLSASYLNIENGAAVDKPVLAEKLSTANISQFYDEDKIGAAVDAAYGN